MIGACCILIDALLDDVAEMPNETLYRPGRRIAQSADCMTFDLVGHIEQHVDLAFLGSTLGHALEHSPHPTCALATGRALAAGLVLVEMCNAGDRFDDVRRFV